MNAMRSTSLVIVCLSMFANDASAQGVFATAISDLERDFGSLGSDSNGISARASVHSDYGGDGNASLARGVASITKGVRPKGNGINSPEIPITLIAVGTATIDGGAYRGRYANAINPPTLGASGGGSASFTYSATFIVSPDASPQAKLQPIPVNFLVNWAVNAAGPVGQASVSLDVNAGAGFSFSAAVDQDGMVQRYVADDDDQARALEDALSASGGNIPRTDFEPGAAKPFLLMVPPNSAIQISMGAQAGGGASGTRDNDWTMFSGGFAFIDPVLQVDSSYAFLDYLSLEYSEGAYLDVDRLYNPLAGTADAAIGEALLNAANNISPVPEPGTWLMFTMGIGIMVLAQRRQSKQRIH